MSSEFGSQGDGKDTGSGATEDFVTVTIADQLFGVPVLRVQDILGPQRITKIPLAPAEVAGALNLRGRIVTAIDLRRRLRLELRSGDDPGMSVVSVVVDFGSELYSLNVDAVGEVLSLPIDDFDSNPSTLHAVWRSVSAGIFRLKDELLVVLDVERLLDLDNYKSAA